MKNINKSIFVFYLQMTMAELKGGGILCLSADQLNTTLIQLWI
jgi:hypothetical protein